MLRIIFLTLSLVSLNAIASDWNVVTSNSSSVYLIDYESISPILYNDTPMLKAWTKEEIKRNVVDLNQPLYKGDYILALEYVDCNNRLMGSKKYITYRDGRILEEYSAPRSEPELDEITPDTYLSAIYERICIVHQIKTGTRSYMLIAQ